MPSSLSLLDPDLSPYVKAAMQESRDLAVIKDHLSDPEYKDQNKEHFMALVEVTGADDLEAVQLITAQANATDGTAINPYEYATVNQDTAVAAILRNALSNASTPLILHLLQQVAIKRYVQNLPADSLIYSALRDMIISNKNWRAVAEFLELANAEQPTRIPRMLPLAKRLCPRFETQQKAMLSGFRWLNRAANTGIQYYDNGVRKQLRGLPMTLIFKIYQYAASDHDYGNKNITRQQILDSTGICPNKIR